MPSAFSVNRALKPLPKWNSSNGPRIHLVTSPQSTAKMRPRLVSATRSTSMVRDLPLPTSGGYLGASNRSPKTPSWSFPPARDVRHNHTNHPPLLGGKGVEICALRPPQVSNLLTLSIVLRPNVSKEIPPYPVLSSVFVHTLPLRSAERNLLSRSA